jgi:hypothetical protein
MLGHGRTVWILAHFILASVGCDPAQHEAGSTTACDPNSIATHFDAGTVGAVRGRVIWTDDIPAVTPFEVWSILMAPDGSHEKRIEPNPNAPVVDAATRGVGNAVVFLRGIDACRARPWDHAPVCVEQCGRHLHILQGDYTSRVGFVRRGDRVEMISRDREFHSLHASGAAFFTLAFPDPDDACWRTLDRSGVIELTSAAGYYSMRAYLFVDDHPYYARTDDHGGFALAQVPPGRYELVGWMPNWIEAAHELDPETAIRTRHFFRPAVQHTRQITLEAGKTTEVQLQFSTRDFQE